MLENVTRAAQDLLRTLMADPDFVCPATHKSLREIWGDTLDEEMPDEMQRLLDDLK